MRRSAGRTGRASSFSFSARVVRRRQKCGTSLRTGRASHLEVLEVFVLRIQLVFKRARWVKPRFSLNLARYSREYTKRTESGWCYHGVELPLDGHFGPPSGGAMPWLYSP
ncbi:hypothetical protein L6452_41485 [Arctium lappa]|uniref:Uncharacterized protein n=1 Tax=Arctium lappa TaxID=4217 RepID=A0ACB8XQT2_ARCLA|nr:hypothetical protein L6452_41485 [Arctium lappa]